MAGQEASMMHTDYMPIWANLLTGFGYANVTIQFKFLCSV